MANATAHNRSLDLRPSDRYQGVIVDTVEVFVGMFAQLDPTTGHVEHWDETGVFLGPITGHNDVALNDRAIGDSTPSAGAQVPKAWIDTSGGILYGVAVGSATKAGVLVYCADSDPANMTITDTTNPPVGVILRFGSDTDCDVKLFAPGEHLAGIADATWNS